ncbi:SX2_G0050290.mRNA.1.CDS.1 [Saccharomyces cerevisiae]|nr:SX2_G0050290.mRNA.1.CDS.1 [Saccharomyces cerevisiae]
MMIIIFIELCRIADSLLWIPKSSRRTSSIFCIPNIIAFIKNEIVYVEMGGFSTFCIHHIIAFTNNEIPVIIKLFSQFSPNMR